MGQYNNPDFLFTFERPAVPALTPVSGQMKLWEMEEDNSYLNYLYPQITKEMQEIAADLCDRIEYEGSLMYDMYPDKISLQRLASQVYDSYTQKNAASTPCEEEHLRNMAEVVLYHEIMFRRNRYRSHRRMYF